MLFYTLYCVCFLPLLASKTSKAEKKSNLETEKSEAIFADVIKNISRVNNVLQELINNYEQLQKLYKSQENFEGADYSSDAEIDRYFKNNKKSVRNKERSFFHYTPSAKTTDYIHETQMIMFENEDVNKSQEVTPETTAKINKQKIVKVKKLSVQKTTPEKTNAGSSEDTYSSEESIEPTTQTTKDIITTTASVITPRLPMDAEIVFVDTHKKMKDKFDKKRAKIMPEALALEQATTRRIKTRYSVKEMPGNKDASYGVVKKSRYLRGRKNVSMSTSKRFLLSDALSEEGTTPEPEEPNIEEKDTKDEPETKLKVSLRSQSETNNKSAQLLVDTDEDKINGVRLEVSKVTDDDDDEDEALTKDMFKTSVLRQAYGDACLKLVVRKCYKACKNVLKMSCRAIKCKSDIKSCYKKSYQSSCDKAFEDQPDAEFRRLLKTAGVHADLTRAGYLSVACQPEIETSLPIAVQNKPPAQTAEQPKDKQLNILRDRYEKACQKISQDKCHTACNSAQNTTCVKYECGKSLKKNFRKNCSHQCKIAYSSKGYSRDSSDESESDDDDSDSETESTSSS